MLPALHSGERSINPPVLYLFGTDFNRGCAVETGCHHEAMKPVKMSTSVAAEFMHGTCTARYVCTCSRCTTLILKNTSYMFQTPNLRQDKKGPEELHTWEAGQHHLPPPTKKKVDRHQCMIMTCTVNQWWVLLPKLDYPYTNTKMKNKMHRRVTNLWKGSTKGYLQRLFYRISYLTYYLKLYYINSVIHSVKKYFTRPYALSDDTD